jgi:hypothetical protein
MDTKPIYINHWKHLHDNLHSDRAKVIKGKVEKLLCISQSAFYRKIKYPDRFLTIAEKIVIAMVYEVEPNYLFPELGAELAGIL